MLPTMPEIPPPPQYALLRRASLSNGLFLYGSREVQLGRALVKRGLALLEDNGSMRGDNGCDDRERWYLTVSETGWLISVG